jgi:hypothetical protein
MKSKKFDRVYIPDWQTCNMIDFLADCYGIATRSKLVAHVVNTYEGLKKENDLKAKEIRFLKIRISILEKIEETKNSQKKGSLFS